MGAVSAPYIRRRHSRAPYKALQCYRDAIAAGGYVNVGMMGDSVTAGQPNSSFPAQDSWGQSWPVLLRNGIGLPVGRDYLSCGESLKAHAGYNWTAYAALAGAAPFVFNGTTSRQNAGWISQVTSNLTGSWPATPLLTFQSLPNCKRLALLYSSYFASTLGVQMSYDLDGTTGTFTTQNVGTTWHVQSFDSGALTPGLHTLKVGNQLVADTFWPHGVVATYLDAGLGWWRIGWSGRTGGDFTTTAHAPSDKPANLLGDYDSVSYASGQPFPVAPHLFIWSLGINDNNETFVDSSLTPTGIYRAIAHTAESLRRGRDNASLVVIGNFYHLGANRGDSSGWANDRRWPAYLRAMSQAADDYDAVFVNFAQETGSLGLAKGYVSVDDGHLTATGHAALANMLLEYLHA